jgi:hypothetical protein
MISNKDYPLVDRVSSNSRFNLLMWLVRYKMNNPDVVEIEIDSHNY